MGTRHLQCTYLGNEYKLAKYCQWDGYPECNGLETLKFVRDVMDEEKYKEAISRCTFILTDEINEMYDQAGIDVSDGWISFDDAKKFGETYPQLTRDMSAEIHEWIQENKLNRIPVINDLEFASNSLSCEWVYVIDMDRRAFEVYKGFNRNPLNENERFINLAPYQSYGEDWYYPVRLVALWYFDKLPTNEEFLSKCSVEGVAMET